MYKRLIAAATIFGAAALAPPAAAQSMPCGPRPEIVAALEQKYDERQTGLGLDARGTLVEVWSSPGSGSWTILATRPDGRSCILGAGRHWQHRDPATDAPWPDA